MKSRLSMDIEAWRTAGSWPLCGSLLHPIDHEHEVSELESVSTDKT